MTASSFQQIAEEMLPMVPASYEKAVVRASLDEGHSAITFSYDDASGADKDIDPDTLRAYRISNLLEVLRAEMQQEGRAPWSSCTFTLFPTGKFNFDVTYDD
jgi:hypothetical protein